jgi:hypothetical protein
MSGLSAAESGSEEAIMREDDMERKRDRERDC